MTLRILFLSGLYSTPRVPWLGIPNARILHAMRRNATIQVVAPIPWSVVAPKPGTPAHQLLEVPRIDVDDDGSPLYHPRRLYVPRAHFLHAGLYLASIALPVRNLVRQFRPDVLLTAWAYPDATAATVLARCLGLPSVVRVMGSDVNEFAQHALRRPQISWALRHADRVIAVSQALGFEVEKLGVQRDHIVIVPTGVDPSRFHPVDRTSARQELGLPQGALILVPSRLSAEKGIHHFLDAFSLLPASTHAVVVGDGNERESLCAQASRLGVGERVHFVGFQPEARMRLYYSAADVTCLPSTEEGWPNVLMESFACGCPVVASRVGGVPEIVALTGDGLTVPPSDPAALRAALADALARTWNRESTANKMLGHTIENTAAQYLETCVQAVRMR